MMDWYGNGMGGGGWIVMTLVMLGFWSLVVMAVVAIFRGSRDTGATTRTMHRDPREILEERFARGEIDAEEYRTRMEVLRDTVG